MNKRVRWLLIGLVVLALGVAIYWRHERDVNQDLESRAGMFTIVMEGGANSNAGRYQDGGSLITVSRRFAMLSASSTGGWSRIGQTGMRISVICPKQSLDDVLRPFVEGLNESPARAKEILQHYDLRMRLLGLAVIEEIVQRQDPITGQPTGPLGAMKPHVLDALAELVKDTDPLIAGQALQLLEKANCFRADVVMWGMQHFSADVRAATAEYCSRRQPSKAQASPAELQTALGQLLLHLDDPHLTVRAMAFQATRELMIALEAKLQGVPLQETNEWTHGVRIIKLPTPPAGYPELTTMNAKDVHAVCVEWGSWLCRQPQYGQEQTTAPADEAAK